MFPTNKFFRFGIMILLGSITAVFASNVASHEISRISVDSIGNQAIGWSTSPSISADGRFVAFSSDASNLVSEDTNGTTDVFVHDRQTKQTTRLSVDSYGNQGNGGSFSPSISADGRFVAFSSDASNLVSEDTNGTTDVFVHDRQTKQTTRVSVDSYGNQGNGASNYALVSAIGRFVAFDSSASNLIPGDTNGAYDVFIHDRETGQTSRVSVDSFGNQAYGDSFSPSISVDGRFVAYVSSWNNTVPGNLTRIRGVYVYDRQTGETARISVDSYGNQGNSDSRNPSISADGRFVAFDSYASNLVLDDTNHNSDIFVHDRQTRQTIRVNVNNSGVEGDGGSFLPTICADGRYITFHSWDSNLVSGDTNNGLDIFVYDSQKFNLIAYHLSANRFLRNDSVIWSGFGWDQENSLPLVWDYDGDGNIGRFPSIISPPTSGLSKGYPGDNMGQFGWGGEDTHSRSRGLQRRRDP